ncbi:Serine/threonine-protein kinase dclk3, partial [Mortierella sp. GBA43]
MVQSFPRGLSITAIGARDLAKRKIFGPQDPYLAFFFQGHRKFTNVAVKGGVKPEWNQVIKYNKIEDPSGDVTLKVTCTHEQTGVKVGSGDGLIGSCEIDLRRILFSKESGEYESWFQLMFDGRESGEVRLRLSLCEPSEEEDENEDAPVRITNQKNRPKPKSDKACDKSSGTSPPSSSTNTSARPSTALGLQNDDKAELQGDGVQRTPSNPLGRRRSFADLQKQRALSTIRQPSQHRIGSKSFEEVREATNFGSPKPTFTSQDSNGNINQLNVLIAPFDPNWLEPTPKLLKRALSKQMYYEDLKVQQTTTQDLFPRSLPQQQPSYNSYQSFSGYPQRPEAPQFPQQFPQQPPQQPPHGMPMGMPQPPPRMTRDQSYPPLSPSAPNWSSPPSKGEIPYQPHSMFQPQPGRSRMDADGNSKYNSLPSRTHFSPQVMQQLRNIGDDGSGQFNGGLMPNPQVPPTFTPQMSSLGPAVGSMPDTYSQEHQRVLVNQIVQPSPFMSQSHGPGSSNGSNMGSGSLMMPGSPIGVMERPGTSNAFYPQSPTAQPMGPMSPTPNYGQQRSMTPGQHSMYGSSPQPQQYGSRQLNQQQQQHQPPMSPQNWSSPPIPVPRNTREVVSAPISLLSTQNEGPTKVRDAIFSQYIPRPGNWEGNDIQDSVFDQSMGRRILGRYSLGLTREKYVRDGYYSKDKSPFMSDSAVQQQRQFQQHQQQRPASARQLQRQFTMDQDGNDRVILKYLKLRRDWEIDCVMMRYLTCQHPEEKLGSQYLDYPQPQQQSQHVNPFVVGMYETFMHPHGSDSDGCRYLSVLQWFPETLQGYISDSIASGEGLEITLPIVRSLIECVEWIHRRKICHLNIKPSNFVRDPYMSSSINHQNGFGWKLVDFEAARVVDEEVVGRCTFSYAAPELLVGNSTNVGILAKTSLDIWSLGLVIHELLTDQPLFKTDEDARDALLQRGNNRGAFKPIRYYDSKNVSPEYIPLLDAMLAQDPEKRLTASQLLQMDIFTKPISPIA